MQLRRLIIAAILFAALAGGVYWSNQHKPEEPKSAADTAPKILSLKDSDLTRVEIKRRGGDDTVLVRDSSGWRITAPQALNADQEATNVLTSSLANVTADRLIEEKATDLAQFGLATPAIAVSLITKDGKSRELLFGDDTPTGGNAYAKLASDARVYSVASFTKTGADKTSKDLRDKRLLTFNADKLSRVELNTKKEHIEFGRSKSNEWQILKPQPMRADGFQVEELIRKLKEAKLDPAADEKVWSTASPVATANVTDASGSQSLDVRKGKDDAYYAKSSVVQEVQKVPADLGTGLDKTVADFRNKKLFDFGFAEPSKIDVRDGAKTYAFQKAGENWISGGRNLDNTSVQALLDKLRDLSATEFVEQSFGSPTLEISVTAGGAHSTEKVLISSPLARRENEPTIYKLDPSSVGNLQRAISDVKPAPVKK